MTRAFSSSRVSTSDVVSFIWRGAVGGSIIPLGFAIYSFSFYGNPLLVLLAPVMSAPAGVTVGIILLLLCSRANLRLRFWWRVLIGGAVLAIPVALYLLISAITVTATQRLYGPGVWLEMFEPAVWYAAIGALAGMCCPAGIRPAEDPRPNDDVESFRDWVPPANHSAQKER